MIKAIGTAARKEIEEATGSRVHLELIVRVRKGWRGDEACWTGWGSSSHRRPRSGAVESTACVGARRTNHRGRRGRPSP